MKEFSSWKKKLFLLDIKRRFWELKRFWEEKTPVAEKPNYSIYHKVPENRKRNTKEP